MPRLGDADFGLWDQLRTKSLEGPSTASSTESPNNNSVESQGNVQTLTPISISNLVPSADFQDDAAFLQSGAFEPDSLFAEDTSIPPPVPQTPECDYYLPPPELGTALLAEYLMDFNTAYPLYRPHVIANHLRICYAGESDESSVSWVSAYVVFGLAHTLRAMSATATSQDNYMSKYYLARVMQAVNNLLFSPPSLGLVQCLLGVSLLIRSTSCGSKMSDSHFVSTALRVAQSLAYHEEQGSDIDSTRDVEQEYRVTWIAFIHDTNETICSNSPMTHRREDIIAAEPEESPSDALGSVVAAEGSWRVNIFFLRAKLATIQAEAIQQLLCIKPQFRNPVDIAAAGNMILARLQAFHSHELFQLNAGQLFQLLYRSDIAHTVSLEASYFATVFRVRAILGLDMNIKGNPFQLERLKKLTMVKDLKCYADARRLLSLLPIAPRGDVALYWYVSRVAVYYSVRDVLIGLSDDLLGCCIALLLRLLSQCSHTTSTIQRWSLQRVIIFESIARS